MVEYAGLIAQSGLNSLQSLGHSADMWLSRVNWEVVGYVGFALIALRIVSWALRPR